MSHTILHGLWRSFIALICSPNGIMVNGKEFRLSKDVMRRIDKIIDAIHLTSAFNRSATKLCECDPISAIVVCYRNM